MGYGHGNTDLSQSWMVGDGENDVKAGLAAGCHTALIGEGAFGQEMSVGSLQEFLEKQFDQKSGQN